MIALLAATMPEAQPLLEQLGAERLPDQAFRVYRFGGTAERPGGVVIISGMGPAAAADAAEHVIARHGAEAIVNFGICGAVSGAAAAGAVFAVAHVVDGDAAGEGSLKLGPGAWPTLPRARLATVREPVFGGSRRAELAARADLVDMEGYAVARAAAGRGVPCSLIKAVSDAADDGGREALRRNIDGVSRRLAAVLAPALRPGEAARPGLLGRLLRLVKVEHTVFSLPLLFGGAWLAAGGGMPPWRVLGLIALAGVGARALGMSANRILDRDLDARNARTAGRELAAGTMNVRAAYLLAAASLAVYLLAAAALGPVCLMLAPAPAVLLLGYSLLKRFTPLCHFGIGACMAAAPLGAWVAVTGNVLFSREVGLLAAFAFFWISGFDIIYALQDMESDRRTGVRSLPAALGSAGAQVVAALVHAAAMAALVGLWRLQGGGMLAGAALAVAAGAMVAAYVPAIPLPARFFPVSAVAGVAGAVIPILGGLP